MLKIIKRRTTEGQIQGESWKGREEQALTEPKLKKELGQTDT